VMTIETFLNLQYAKAEGAFMLKVYDNAGMQKDYIYGEKK